MNTFKKEERLCSKNAISEVLNKGNSFFLPPFKVFWLPYDFPGSFPVQIAISVPKRNFKKAVDRNKIKRIIRECYRIKKHSFYDYLSNTQRKLIFFLIYTSKEALSYKEIEGKIILTLQRLQQEHEKCIK